VNYTFHVQDPTDPATTYLYETIIRAMRDAVSWRGLYAFASQGGVDKLVADDAVIKFFKRGGKASLTVGIDAVTNRTALERLVHYTTKHRSFSPSVFWTPNTGLFHPKLSHFRHDDGRETLVVGSGNLTPGGLTSNFEAYTVISSEPGEALDVSSFDAFLMRHAGIILPIDEKALARAALNIVQKVKGKAKVVPAEALDDAIPIPETVAVTAIGGTQRVLVAQIPKGKGRWKQGHFNADTIQKFFRISDRQLQRVFLTYVFDDGSRGEEEPSRCIYSKANKNFKIEIKTGGQNDYPPEGRPIVVFLERNVRIFDYLLRMPGMPGHAQMQYLTETLPQVGKGLPRVITDTDRLRTEWPSCPLLLPPP
jgi:HKD family nuclease